MSTGANKSSESSERKIKEDDKVQSDFIDSNILMFSHFKVVYQADYSTLNFPDNQ